jgi:hypothetical protein
MTINSPHSLSDAELLAETRLATDRERRSTADLLALLAELDSRRLYLGEGFSSLFTYCTHVLHLSEPAAYSRITAARAARRFPTLLTLLANGDITLSTVSLVAGHLTDDNHMELIDSVRHKSKRDVEQLVASLQAQPDIRSSIRRLPTRQATSTPRSNEEPQQTMNQLTLVASQTPVDHVRKSVVAPISAERHLLKITLGASGRTALDRARDLLRHSIPSGDPAAIVEKALTVFVKHLERHKCGALQGSPRQRPHRAGRPARGRHIPSKVKREVWSRDQGRCAFAGSHGRCTENAFLEFHHVRPYAMGGSADRDNIELRCRAHNQYESERAGLARH